MPSTQFSNGSVEFVSYELAFRCPLGRRCLRAEVLPYPTIEALNASVARYQSCPLGSAKDERAWRLFARCLPLVRKALVRFCPFSQCRPGACMPEELVGETYFVFVRALDDYRSDSGVDFLGYLAGRLRWGLRHEARRLSKAPPVLRRDEGSSGTPRCESDEARILDRLSAEGLLSGVSEDEAALMRLRYAEGYLHRELAEMTGLSHAAVRKRLERLRRRLKACPSSRPRARREDSSFERRARKRGSPLSPIVEADGEVEQGIL